MAPSLKGRTAKREWGPESLKRHGGAEATTVGATTAAGPEVRRS